MKVIEMKYKPNILKVRNLEHFNSQLKYRSKKEENKKAYNRKKQKNELRKYEF